MNATEDFFDAVGVGHMVAAALQFYEMKDVSDQPKDATLKNAITLPRARKWEVLSASIRPLLEKYVVTSLSCPHHSQHFDPDTSDDGIYEYACCVLSLALFMFEFKDAIKEGDGERVHRVWKYLLLLYRESGRTKYALEALNLHFQHYGLPPHIAFEIKWSRFVNSNGGRGKNISCDLHMEHLNRALKTSILGLGANISDKSVTRSANCLRTVLEVSENFDIVNDIHPQSSKHSIVSAEKDIKTIVQELTFKSKVFAEKPGRSHCSFRNCRKNRFGTIDWDKLTKWFDTKKNKFMEIHTTVDEDFL
jgi:L1 cell adhesion molecule like protein